MHEFEAAAGYSLADLVWFGAQQLSSSSDHHEERSETDVAKASLLAIKAHKLGWPVHPD
jgi:hypothetical protein